MAISRDEDRGQNVDGWFRQQNFQIRPRFKSSKIEQFIYLLFNQEKGHTYRHKKTQIKPNENHKSNDSGSQPVRKPGIKLVLRILTINLIFN